ncbi:hypothetical protein [Microbacterium sp. NPDC076911]|uniref:hypothetical protein n=1 Tax=Microbacterium sp. NPDC076911 TaxID=3154958 RepID=UPI0034486F40
MSDRTLDAVLEIFGWAGFGLGALLALVAVVLYLADGTWLPVRALLEDSPGGRIARWFDADGGVGSAHLSHDLDHALAGKDEADVFYRRGTTGHVRLTRGSPIVRGVLLLALGLISFGMLALVASGIILFARG